MDNPENLGQAFQNLDLNLGMIVDMVVKPTSSHIVVHDSCPRISVGFWRPLNKYLSS